MPRGDKTGPLGIGPMSGRRMRFCAGNRETGNTNGRKGPERERMNQHAGISYRSNHGFCNRYYATGIPCGKRSTENKNGEKNQMSELEILKSCVDFLEQQKTMLIERIHMLENNM